MRGLKLTRRGGKGMNSVHEDTNSMNRNFMDRFNFIFGVIQTCALVVGIIVGFVYIAQFSYELGRMETRINVLELQNPLKGGS